MSYLNLIEPIAQAPADIRRLALSVNSSARACAMVRLPRPETDTVTYPILRDRSPECRLMLGGLVGDLDAEVVQQDFTGPELVEQGFAVVGSAIFYTYRLLVA